MTVNRVAQLLQRPALLPRGAVLLDGEVRIAHLDTKHAVATIFKCALGYGVRVTKVRKGPDGPEAASATYGRAGWQEPGPAFAYALDEVGLGEGGE